MEHILTQLGVFFALSAAMALVFAFFKQSTVLAYIAVGLALGAFKATVHLEQHVIDVISEIGIVLLLFLAGMELDLGTLRKRLRITVTNGLGQILLFTAIGVAVGYFLLGIGRLAGLIYFGLCLAFSSTIIVVKLLKDRKEIDSFHGQTLIGILIMQDIVAIFALVFLNSLGSTQPLPITVLYVLGKMLVLFLVLFLFSRFVLNYAFKKFAQTPELLFIGSLGYVFGVAAICESINFSPELGAFLAGVSLANIPYKLEIEDKVEPIKNLGIVLFFVSLGYNLNVTSSLITFTPSILGIAALVVFLTPVAMLLLGYLQKLKTRPMFYIGVMMNQISEFSLILATLCLREKVFDNEVFTVITFASIISILLSSIGHSFITPLYGRMKNALVFMEKHSLKLDDMIELDSLELANHIVLLEYNEITDYIADYFASKEIPVIILDFDPEKINHIEKNESSFHHAIYADPLDPDIWEELKLENASLIVSGIAANNEAELTLMRYLKGRESEATVIVHADSYESALELYEHDVAYVLLPNHIGGEKIVTLLDEVEHDYHRIKDSRDAHRELIHSTMKKFMETKAHA